VRTFLYKGRIGVAVSDNGPGIPPEEREAVLRRFHRLEKSRHTPGSGLGLSLVAAVAKLHGLSLTIDSSYPGSCVTLEREAPSQVIPQPTTSIAAPAASDVPATAGERTKSEAHAA
jgi:K+-sensing histidine kinase KdpD